MSNQNNITTSDIFFAYNRILDLVSTEEAKEELSSKKRNLTSLQIQKIRSYGARLLYKDSVEERSALSEMDFIKLEQDLSNRFYNPELLKVSSAASSMIFLPSPLNLGAYSQQVSIRNWLKNPKYIPEKSTSESSTLSVKNPEDTSLFLLKVPNKPKKIDNIVHEYFVGAFGTNNLRLTGLPTFIYVYGLFSCSPPVIDEKTGEVGAWCTNSSSETSTAYLAYENTGSRTLRNLLPNMSGEDFLGYYLTILYSLAIAQEKIGFSHYNCTDENILLRPYSTSPQNSPQNSAQNSDEDQGFFLPLKTEKGMEYMLLKHIPTIYNFALSSFEYEGKRYGTYDYLFLGVRPDTSYAMYDAYKLLMWSMNTAQEAQNQSVLDIGSTIFSFFNNTEDFEMALKEQKKSYYSLPFENGLVGISFYTLTTFIREQFSTNFILPSVSTNDSLTYPILSCEGFSLNACEPASDIAKDINYQPSNMPISVIDFFDAYFGNNLEDRKVTLKNNFTKVYKMSMRKHIIMFNEKLKELEEATVYLICMDMSRISLDKVYTTEVYNNYSSHVYRISKIYDIILEMKMLVFVGSKVADLFSDINISNELIVGYAQLEMVIEKVRNCIKAINTFSSSLYNRVINDSEAKALVNSRVESNSDFTWYLRGLTNFNYSVRLESL